MKEYNKFKDGKVPSRGKGSKLTAKQEKFVEEFLIDLNASAACLRAGYQTKNPNRVGTQLLHHVTIKPMIEARLEARREKNEITADYVLTKLVSIVEDQEKGNPQAALRGLELLGKHLGLYKDRQEISGPDGNAIEMEQRVKEDVADFTSSLARLIDRGGASPVVSFPKREGKG